MNYFMKSKAFEKIEEFDKFAILVSASVHDVGHPGHNNGYEIQTESELAITYNDRSVLENFHIAFAWRLMNKSEDSNILMS